MEIIFTHSRLFSDFSKMAWEMRLCFGSVNRGGKKISSSLVHGVLLSFDITRCRVLRHQCSLSSKIVHRAIFPEDEKRFEEDEELHRICRGILRGKSWSFGWRGAKMVKKGKRSHLLEGHRGSVPSPKLGLGAGIPQKSPGDWKISIGNRIASRRVDHVSLRGSFKIQKVESWCLVIMNSWDRVSKGWM